MVRKTFCIPIIILLATMNYLDINAQVTIGYDQDPARGALLQLKENDNINNNSTKGLGLPRLELTDLESLTDIIGNPDPIEHIGLLVYNVNNSFCTNPNPIHRGIYVWIGNSWEPGFSENKTPVAGTGTVTDRDGNVYPTMHYITEVNGVTTDAGTWMTQNLRVTRYDTNIVNPPGLTPTYILSDAEIAADTAIYYFPKPLNDNIAGNITQDRTFFDSHPEFGLMYNWYAATAKKNNAGGDNQGQGETNEQTEVFQGICPNNWHLPSDKEWNLLEKVIALSPEKYSTYPAGSTTWDDQWNETVGFRPSSGNGQGLAMQMPCKIVVSQYNDPNGKSLPNYKGGFNVLFVGFINVSIGKEYGYGAVGIYWSSSSHDTGNAWFRELILGENGMDRNRIGKNFLGSVRCVKD